MRFSAPILSIVALSALFAPALPTFGVSPELNERLTQTELPTLAQASDTSARQAEADRLYLEGIQQYNVSQYQAAFESWQMALEIYQEIENPIGKGDTLNALGLLFRISGQPQTAIDYHQQALAIAREIGDRAGEGRALGNLGLVYDSLGQYELAIDLYEQRLATAREIGDQVAEGITLGNLGVVYDRLGQYGLAIDLYEQRLAIAREIGDRAGEGAALGNLGNAYKDLGQYERAIGFYEQALAIAREIGDKSGEGDVLANWGIAHHSLDQYEHAIDLYEQHLAIAREIGDKSGEGTTLGNLGIAYRNLGQHERAISFYEQSLAIVREIGDRAGEGRALNNQGAALLITEQFPQAEVALRQAIQVYESLRTELSDDQLISLADTQFRAYANLEDALVAQDKTAEALAISERARARARAFVLQLANRLDPSDQALLAKAPTVAEIQQIARDTNTTLVTYSLIFNSALYIWVVQPTGDIHFRSVEFDGADRPIINPIASLDSPVYRSAPDSELTALVNDSRAIGVVAANPEGNPQSLKSLHEILIDPIADLLPSDPNDQIAFIPQGNLFLVPFAALQDSDGTYLIEKHTLLTAPSIQVFGLANAAGANGHSSLQTDNALIVGNPTMPTVFIPNDDGELTQTPLAPLIGAQLEAEAIGNLFQIPVLTGDQASEARIKQLLPEASLIHLATHGLLEYGNPQTSGVLDVPGAVALAPGNGEDGLLTSAEILEMDLQAELAILSACDTGLGRITGDGVVGLSRALITAGVPSVMVSLWAVNDDSTRLLMQRFYELLASEELTKAQALRQAQLSLLYNEDTETRLAALRAGAPPQSLAGNTLEGYQQPYHWAPFVLMGDGS